MSDPHNVPDNTPYREETTLRELYHGKGLDSREIAERYGVSKTTILDWMDRHEIQRRDNQEAQTRSLRKNPPWHTWHPDGYEMAGCEILGETKYVLIHRLAAVAWFGWGAVEDKVVHHENEVKWDNREENLSPMSDSAHKSYHITKRHNNS